MTRQCLARRIDNMENLQTELAEWECYRNKNTARIYWHFTAENAREKLMSLYPKLEVHEPLA